MNLCVLNKPFRLRADWRQKVRQDVSITARILPGMQLVAVAHLSAERALSALVGPGAAGCVDARSARCAQALDTCNGRCPRCDRCRVYGRHRQSHRQSFRGHRPPLRAAACHLHGDRECRGGCADGPCSQRVTQACIVYSLAYGEQPAVICELLEPGRPPASRTRGLCSIHNTAFPIDDTGQYAAMDETVSSNRARALHQRRLRRAARGGSGAARAWPWGCSRRHERSARGRKSLGPNVPFRRPMTREFEHTAYAA